jgi:hypothetical protein
MVVGELSRFFRGARSAVAFGGSEDGLVPVHFDDDVGITRDFTRVEGSYADDYARGQYKGI